MLNSANMIMRNRINAFVAIVLAVPAVAVAQEGEPRDVSGEVAAYTMEIGGALAYANTIPTIAVEDKVSALGGESHFASVAVSPSRPDEIGQFTAKIGGELALTVGEPSGLEARLARLGEEGAPTPVYASDLPEEVQLLEAPVRVAARY